MEIKTKKAAKQLGLRTFKGWLCISFAPRRGEVPVRVKDDEFYREDQCEHLISRTKGRRRRLTLTLEADPVGRLFGAYTHYEVFRESDFVPMRAKAR